MNILQPLMLKPENKSLAIANNKAIEMAPETKSVPTIPLPLSQLLVGYGWHDLIAYQALVYYRACSPLFTAIEIITDEIAKIKPVIFDEKKKEYIEDHPALELLKRPFADTTFCEFIKQMAVFYLVTGNNYTVLTGNVDRPPLEMVNIHPTEISILANQWDGYNEFINAFSSVRNESFQRDEKQVKGQWRFINAQRNREVWQIRSFNSRYQGLGGYYGMSILTPIYYEIEQHLQGSIHNRALLINGAKLSMFFSTEGNLTQDQYDRLVRQIQKAYEGAQNAGKTMLGESGLKAQEMGMNNKDMDYYNLKTTNVHQIYNTLKVPLALIDNDKSTFDNMANAMLRLYFNAVLPLTEKLYDELTMFLLPRYEDSENCVITYKPDKIPALEHRKMQIAKEKKQLEVYSDNEIRTFLGDKPYEGGDSIYKQAAMIPVATIDEEKSKEEFMRIMLEQKNQDGSQRYNQQQVKEMAAQNGF